MSSASGEVVSIEIDNCLYYPAALLSIDCLTEGGSVLTCVQNRLPADGGHGERLIVETNLPRQGPNCHDRHDEGQDFRRSA
jgi:hypothetical protein